MNKKISSVFLSVLSLTILSQILNMLKSIYLANDFGASQLLDSFYLGNVFTITIFNILGVAMTTILIPELSSLENVKVKKKSIEQYITMIFLIVFIFITILYAILYFGVDIVAPNFNDDNKKLFLILTLILAIGQFFRIQTAFSTAIFQTNGSFIMPKVAGVISGIFPIIYLVYVQKSNIILLTWFIVIGYVFECLYLLLFQVKNRNNIYKLRLGKLESNTKKLLANTLPIILSSTVFQFQMIVSNYVIGFFGEGYISILSNTNQIVGIFQLLFISNIITIVYPKIAKDVKISIDLTLKNLSKYIAYTNILIILLVWGFISLGNELIKIMFVRGNFSLADGNLVYYFGIGLIIALPISVIRDYLYRFLYSIDDVNTPTKNAIQTVILNIALIVILQKFIGPYSVVLSPLLGTIVSTVNIVLKLNKLGHRFNFFLVLKNFMIFNIFGLLMMLFLHFFSFNFRITVVNFILNAILGAIIYGILSYFYLKIFDRGELSIDKEN